MFHVKHRSAPQARAKAATQPPMFHVKHRAAAAALAPRPWQHQHSVVARVTGPGDVSRETPVRATATRRGADRPALGRGAPLCSLDQEPEPKGACEWRRPDATPP